MEAEDIERKYKTLKTLLKILKTDYLERIKNKESWLIDFNNYTIKLGHYKANPRKLKKLNEKI